MESESKSLQWAHYLNDKYNNSYTQIVLYEHVLTMW